MATGHILPGFQDPVTRLRHARSAPGGTDARRLRKMVVPLTPESLDDIKMRAREEWSRPDTARTTYNSTHYNKVLDEPTRSLPTELERKNKPHPELVFLTCRLHHVPGYHNADAALGKDIYRMDASVPNYPQRRSVRDKYSPRVSAKALRQYEGRNELEEILPPREAQAAEAWLKLSDERDKRDVLDMLQTMGEDKEAQESALDPTVRPEVVPSLHRWLKRAGVEEANNVGRLFNSLQTNPNGSTNTMIPYLTTSNVGARRADSLEKRRRVVYQYKPHRGDFLMHPDWPPTLRAHRLPDWPELPPRRNMPGPM